MGNSRQVTTTRTDEGVDIEISSVWSGWELVTRAAKTGQRFALVAAGTVVTLLFVYGMFFARKYSVAWVWDVFVSAIWRATPTTGLYVVAPLVAAWVSGVVVSIWRNRSLAESYQLEFDGRELECTKRTIVGERTVFCAPADGIRQLQEGPVEAKHRREQFQFPEPHEMTVVTDEDLHTFGSGLREGNCLRVTQMLEQTAERSNEGNIPWRREAAGEFRTPSRSEGLDEEDVEVERIDPTSGLLGGFWRRYRLTLGGSAVLAVASATGLMAWSGVINPSSGANSILNGLFYEYFPILCFAVLGLLAVVIPVAKFVEYRRLFGTDEAGDEAPDGAGRELRVESDATVFEFGDEQPSGSSDQDDETEHAVEAAQKSERVE